MVTAVKRFDASECLRTLTAIEADMRRLAGALTEAQFHAPPRDGGWSAGYCIEHLVLAGRAFLPKWDAAMEGATTSQDTGALAYGWGQQLALSWLQNPSRMRQRTRSAFVPYMRHSIGETIDRFLDMHSQIARRVSASRGLDIRRLQVQSPFYSWLRYSLGFSFDLALAHERRHISQAWRVGQGVIVEPGTGVQPVAS